MGCCYSANPRDHNVIEEVTQPTDEFINQYSHIQSRFYQIDIVARATNNFSENLIIGRGEYGNVYACKIDGNDVAVKRLAQDSHHGVREFENEIKFLSGLDHENVIRLVGYSVTQVEKIIIYELMSSNSLASLLFDVTKRKRLDWSTRVKIIRGIANGLNYLHNKAAPNLIHRDIKAGNILLDSNWIAKIADFGLAKNANMLDNQSPPKGTVGYWDPHYFAKGELSRKTDVYSFGVIILEMLTGEKSTKADATSQPSHISYIAWAKICSGQIMLLADRLLGGNIPQTEFAHMLTIGMLCVQDDIDERPSSEDLVNMLENFETPLPQPMKPVLYDDAQFPA